MSKGLTTSEWKHSWKSVDFEDTALELDKGDESARRLAALFRNPFDPIASKTALERAIDDIDNGKLTGLLEYLKDKSNKRLHAELRDLLIGCLEGDASCYPRRLILAKHPDAKGKFVTGDQESEYWDRFTILLQAYHFAGGFKRGWQQRAMYFAQQELIRRTGEKLSLKRLEQILSSKVLKSWKPFSEASKGTEMDLSQVYFIRENSSFYPTRKAEVEGIS
jgi:hypothetical protein